MICEAHHRLQPGKSPPSVSAHQSPESTGDATIQAGELVTGCGTKRVVAVLQANLEINCIRDRWRERSTPAVVTGDKVKHQVAVVRVVQQRVIALHHRDR
jgi:hypothetical protein